MARRKNLPKFGMSKEDRPGPNPQTTIVAEDVFMAFIAGKVTHPYLLFSLILINYTLFIHCSTIFLQVWTCRQFISQRSFRFNEMSQWELLI